MNCCRHATGPPIAPEARDTSNYRFVSQIGLKTLLLQKTVLIISIISIDVSLFVLCYRLYFTFFYSSYHIFVYIFNIYTVK